MPSYGKTAIAYVGLKEAILYFEHVICVSEFMDVVLSRMYSKRLIGSVSDELDQVVALRRIVEKDLLPPKLRTKKFIEIRRELHDAINIYIASQAMENKSVLIENAFEEAKIIKGLQRAWQNLSRLYPSTNVLPMIMRPELTSRFASEEEADISLTVASLKLIDTDACEWEQLLEFRKDTEAMSKLRRLRLFAYENYRDKSRDFIEDDIHTRILDYERAVKKWGFTTTTGAINTLLDSKLIAGGVAGSFLTAYLQEPLLAIAAMIGTAGIAIAKLGIELGKRNMDRVEIMATNPVSYISYARKKLRTSEK